MAKGIDLPPSSPEQNNGVSAAPFSEWRLTPARLLAYSLSPSIPPPSPPRSLPCFKPLDRSRKKIDAYNKRRDALLQEFGRLDDLARLDDTPTPDEAETDRTSRWETFAINISTAANFLIFAGTVFVAGISGSLALIASALDSLLDMLSGLILWYTSMKMRKPNPQLYPIGKQRMQTVGILVFSAVMASMGFVIVIISVEKLVSKEKAVDLKGNKAYLVIVIMGVSIVVMFALAAYCQTFKSKLVRAYADDHLFDALTNVVGLASAILAAKFRWWIDPLGALVLALYTILCWTGKVKKNVRRLVARSAPPEMLQKITYVCWNHDERISKIDTVRAYTSGDKYVAEVDIVLPKETPLVESHDIAEALQNRLEKLPYLERAFVHVDYDTCHKPEHS